MGFAQNAMIQIVTVKDKLGQYPDDSSVDRDLFVPVICGSNSPSPNLRVEGI
jgi:hypothetical protein